MISIQKLLVLFCTMGFVISGMAQKHSPAYKDKRLSVEERTKDLLQRMTLEEKIGQMCHIHNEHFDKNRRVNFSKLGDWVKDGSFGCVEALPLSSLEYAKAIYHLQRRMKDSTRLGIPVIPVIEGLHGVVQDEATIYPQSIALAATFNPDYAFRMADNIGELVKRMGVKQVLSPVLDLARELRWGRVEETYGEDPLLVADMGAAYVQALRKHQIICTPKHFIGHGSPLGGLNLASVEGGKRQLLSIYLQPFERIIRYGNPLSVMNCYSSYDGEPVAGSSYMMTELLRNQLGFKGYAYSDWNSISMLDYFHKTANGPADAARQAVIAGIDLEAGGGDFLLLRNQVKNGTLDIRYVDSAVSHILYTKFASGLFDDPLPDTTNLQPFIHTKESVLLSKQIADESAVLLKNSSVLPLQLKNIKSIAVVGPNANQVQFGDYSWSRNNKDGVTPLKGIENYVGQQIKINYAAGCDLVSQNKNGFTAAVDAAKASDVVVVFVGSQSASLARDYSNSTSGEGFDLSDLTLPGVQEDLIRELKTSGKPLIVVLVTGKPFAIPWIKKNADAVIVQWYAGEQEGNAIAGILFGKVNPSGKLPVSFPQSVGHLPAYYNHLSSDKGYYKKPGSLEKPGRDYVFSSSAPLWAFGYGLSYTRFNFENIRASKEDYALTDTIEVTLDIKNSGDREGKEVVQLYITDLVSSVATPNQQLKAYQKVLLQTSETKKISLRVPVQELYLYDSAYRRKVEEGAFELRIGSSSDDIKWKKIIQVGNNPGEMKRFRTQQTKTEQRNAEIKPGEPVVISGVVRDVQATVLEGVKVSVKNNKAFVLTGANGAYAIKAKTGDVLLFTAKGYATQEVVVKNEGTLNVKLQTK